MAMLEVTRNIITITTTTTSGSIIVRARRTNASTNGQNTLGMSTSVIQEDGHPDVTERLIVHRMDLKKRAKRSISIRRQIHMRLGRRTLQRLGTS